MKLPIIALLLSLAALACFGSARAATRGTLEAGAEAPDFTCKATDGTDISLKALRGKRAVVLFFYPKDETSVCTKEACTFRDSYQQFQDLGAEVIGVSGDSDASHKEFANHHRLPFHLISDADGSLRKLYRVPAALGVVPGRVTFVIDKQGVIRLVFNNMTNGESHVKEALAALRAAK